VKAKKQAMADNGSESSRQAKKAMRAMTKHEATAFLEAARKDRYFPYWAVLLTGGLRPGEALGLLWEDVDLEEGKIHIQRSLTRRGIEGWQLTEPKTDRARRVVPLPDVTTRALRDWRKKQAEEKLKLGAEYEGHGFVFATEFGAPLDGANLSNRNFRTIMAAAELGAWEGEGKKRRFRPGHRVYDLRHSCATLLLLAGEHAKVVSERLGHASITLTLDTYSHVLPDMQEQAAEKMEAMFGGA
jgi:integrase